MFNVDDSLMRSIKSAVKKMPEDRSVFTNTHAPCNECQGTCRYGCKQQVKHK